MHTWPDHAYKHMQTTSNPHRPATNQLQHVCPDLRGPGHSMWHIAQVQTYQVTDSANPFCFQMANNCEQQLLVPTPTMHAQMPSKHGHRTRLAPRYHCLRHYGLSQSVLSKLTPCKGTGYNRAGRMLPHRKHNLNNTSCPILLQPRSLRR